MAEQGLVQAPLFELIQKESGLHTRDGMHLLWLVANNTLARQQRFFNGLIPQWEVTHSVDQTISDDTDTQLSFDTSNFDADGMHDVSVNNGRATVNTPGRYFVYATIQWEIHGNGPRKVEIIKNDGSSDIVLSRTLGPGGLSTHNISQVAFASAEMLVGQYFAVQAWQTNSTSISLDVLSAQLLFAGFRTGLPV